LAAANKRSRAGGAAPVGVALGAGFVLGAVLKKIHLALLFGWSFALSELTGHVASLRPSALVVKNGHNINGQQHWQCQQNLSSLGWA
jgi:hypothetical protein